MKICSSLVFLVVVVQEAYCGVVEKNAETQKEVEVFAKNEADTTKCGLGPQDNIPDSEKSSNSELLYDTNMDPSLDSNSDGVKHKRCHHSYSRVGASLEPRAGIVGAKAPQAKERRDLQNKLYTKACSTCLGHYCKDKSNCPVCEKLCAKAALNDEPNEVNANAVVGAPQEIASPEEPVISVRSNFDDEKRKKVYTITTLRTGPMKDLFMKVLGLSNPEDIDTFVIWVTTHSNHPPLISRDFNGELDLEGENAVEAWKKDLKSKGQKFHQNGKKFMKEGEEGMDNVIRNLLTEWPPKISGSKAVDNSEIDRPRSDTASEMLPRYPIESGPLIVPQLMNPGIIEGPPNFRTTDGESEDPDNLAAIHEQVEEGSISQDEQTLGVPQEFTDRTASLSNPSLDGNRDEEGSKSQVEQTLGVPQGFTDQILPILNPNSDGNRDPEKPPEFLLRAGNQPKAASLPLDSRPRPFAASQGQETALGSIGGNEATGVNNLGTPLENSVNEKFEALKKSTLTAGMGRVKDQMERVKDQMAPGARLREFIDNVKANIVSSKNVLPNQRKFLDSSLQRIESADLESGDDAQSTLGRPHHGGRGHGNKGHHILHPHNHRSSTQDDNIGIFKPKEKIETTTNIPDSGPLIQKLPLRDNITTVPIILPSQGAGTFFSPVQPLHPNLFSRQNKDDSIGSENSDALVGAELEKNADSENHDMRSSERTHGHGKGHHPGHGQGHHKGHGGVHHPRPIHGQGKGHWHRSSESGNPEILNLSEERKPWKGDSMLAEPVGEAFENEYPKNNAVGSTPTNSVGAFQSESQTKTPVVPVKFNVGARANELIQKLKERQEMRKASLNLQSSPSRASPNDLGGSARTVEGTVEPSVDSGRTVGVQAPFRTPEINNFENAEAALGEINDLSRNLQEITDTVKPSVTRIKTDEITPKHVTDYAQQNTIKDENENPNVGVNTPEILGSQPLENSLERIQPSMSLSGRPWHNHNSANAFIDEPKNEITGELNNEMVEEPKNEMVEEPQNEMVEEPSLGSANPEGDLESQNLNEIAGPEMVGESNPDMNTRGQFEGEQNSFSNSMGAIVPLENPIDLSYNNKPSDVYFLGNGIKLPMKMAKGTDGVLHLSVDLDKLCSCNNITCPKNHTVLEKAVETILENEADELKEQLEPIVGEGIEPQNMQADYGDMPLGMASPQGLFEDGPSDFEGRVEMQPRMGAFEEDAMEDVREEQMALSHRNQRDTDEEIRSLDRKNKIAGSFDSMELQSDNTGVVERSPEVKVKRLHVPMKKFVVTPTNTPHKSGDVQRQQNSILKNSKSNDRDDKIKLGNINVEGPKTTIPSESTTKTGESTTKTSSSEPDNFQQFMNKKFDDIRSRLEIRDKDMKKELSFPEYFFKNLWAAGKEQAEKIASNLNTNNPAPMLGTRLGSLFGKTAPVNNQVYENLAPITKPYKFKALENQLKSNLEHIGDTVDNYTKRDDEILKEEVAALDKIAKNPVVRKEVGIVSNILKLFKDLAADRNKRK